MKKLFNLLLIWLVCLAGSTHLWPVQTTTETQQIIADRLPDNEKIVIDGNLDESPWQLTPIRETFKTLTPVFGQDYTDQTLVWAAYDPSGLYFAFRCHEKKPDKLKTSVTQRDKIGTDDMVAVLLDSIGSRQSSYEFYVNPSGIQMDASNSSVSSSDFTPDFIWESAAKLSTDGYQVEIRIPLETIRYRLDKHNNAHMRVMFVRQVSYEGVLASWPAIVPGQTDLNCMVPLLVQDLKKTGHKLELLPNFTSSRTSDRIGDGEWARDTDTDYGIGIKYGITSAITGEATINPDFSQVESDVFQVETNQRYPLFYSEKRPFFMESQEVMDFTIVHDTMASVLERGMMISPIHTRRIVDPEWAVKLSGATGKFNFALLSANDRSPGREWGDEVNPFAGKSALFGILRAKYNFGQDNSVGVLYTGRHFPVADESNDVAGLDLKYRLDGHTRASASYLLSSTQPGSGGTIDYGRGFNAVIQRINSKYIAMTAYEYYDSDFLMATAFQNRIGISRWWFGFGPYLNIHSKALPWLKRLVPYIHYANLKDLDTHLNDISRVFGLYMNFAPRGELYLEYRVEDEAWKGKAFDKNYLTVHGNIQLNRWLSVQTHIYHGGQIYYDSPVPFTGRDTTLQVSTLIQPSLKFKFNLDYTYSHFKDKETLKSLYKIDIFNFQGEYQFNRYFFVRAILRYDNDQEKLLTDFLASFTLIPGTVVHLGYGALYQENARQDNAWVPGSGEFLKMRQGLFFKASYVWKIK